MKSNKAFLEKSRKFANISTSRQNKKQMISATFLCEDIFFNMLTRLPAQDLYDRMGYVCKSWAAIINDLQFVEAHLDQSKQGLFLQDPFDPYGSRFLEIKDDGAISRQTFSKPCFIGGIRSSCGGLAVVSDYYHWGKDYIVNFATTKAIEIPQLLTVHSMGIARVSRPRECKLAFPARCSNNGSVSTYFYVLTIGIDKSWRMIDYKIDDLSTLLIYNDPISIGKFIFWTCVSNNQPIVALDLDRESIHVFCSPFRHDYQCNYLNGGDYLACVSRENVIYTSASQHTMYILADVQSAKWVLHRKFTIALPPELGVSPQIRYICCLGNNGELIVLAEELLGKRMYFAFSLKTGKLRCIDNYIKTSDCLCVHTNSLVSW